LREHYPVDAMGLAVDDASFDVRLILPHTLGDIVADAVRTAHKVVTERSVLVKILNRVGKVCNISNLTCFLEVYVRFNYSGSDDRKTPHLPSGVSAAGFHVHDLWSFHT